MPAHQSERSAELQNLLRRLRPQILDLLRDHAVGEDAAAEIVHDTFMALAVRWGRVGNRESWILSTIEARCRSARSERGDEGPGPSERVGGGKGDRGGRGGGSDS